MDFFFLLFSFEFKWYGVYGCFQGVLCCLRGKRWFKREGVQSGGGEQNSKGQDRKTQVLLLFLHKLLFLFLTRIAPFHWTDILRVWPGLFSTFLMSNYSTIRKVLATRFLHFLQETSWKIASSWEDQKTTLSPLVTSIVRSIGLAWWLSFPFRAFLLWPSPLQTLTKSSGGFSDDVAYSMQSAGKVTAVDVGIAVTQVGKNVGMETSRKLRNMKHEKWWTIKNKMKMLKCLLLSCSFTTWFALAGFCPQVNPTVSGVMKALRLFSLQQGDLGNWKEQWRQWKQRKLNSSIFSISGIF